jgi:hypothetical protein
MKDFQGYLLFEGEGGWTLIDRAFFVSLDGNVKQYDNLLRKGLITRAMLSEESVNATILLSELDDLEPSEDIQIEGNVSDMITEHPFRAGCDGIEVQAFEIKEGKMNFLWAEEKHGQIPILSKIHHGIWESRENRMQERE